MADDEKGVKPADPSPVAHPAAPGAHEPGAREPGAHVTGADEPGAEMSSANVSGAQMAPQTEWTASDRRGPLGSAADEDVERFVPAHETDAEGGIDAVAHDPNAVSAMHKADEAGRHDTIPRDGEALNDGEAVSATPASVEDEPRHATPSAQLAASPEPKRSLVPVAAGLVIGASVGAGSAWLVYSQSGGGAADPQQLAALSSRVDTLDKRPDPRADVAKLQSRLADLQGKVAALEKQTPVATVSREPRPAAAPSQDQAGSKSSGEAARVKPAPSTGSTPTADAGLAGRIAALQAALDEMKTRTSALQAQDAKEGGAVEKLAALQSGVADAQKQAAGARSAIETFKSEQRQLGDKIAALTAAVADARKQSSLSQSGIETVRDQQKTLEGKLGSPALAVVADSLVQQIDAGQPFARQVDALATLNADPARIAVLRENAARGVPSARALLGQWKPLVDPVIATGNRAPANAGFRQRLEHGLFGLVTVRRADGTAGNDLASRVNLIEADLARGDVPGAYATWQALPADARARSDSWGALAKTCIEALAAARDLQRSAIDALGAKKS